MTALIRPVLILMTLSCLVFLSACMGPSKSDAYQASRYDMENDSPELEPFDLSSVQEVVPVVEVRTRAGNKNPYTVNGQTYHLMETELGYEETGMASWYGRKFHGHLTSNGEVYDMFQLSAAHKTLPIPGYLKVTNLDNGKSVVVRVNDRGPFHEGRVVDLSFAAASVLGYADKGTARVKVEALVADTKDSGEYLQVGAYSNLASAHNIVAEVSTLTSLPVFIRSESSIDSNNSLHRVRIGPLNETMEVQGLIQSIVDLDLGTPIKVRQ